MQKEHMVRTLINRIQHKLEAIAEAEESEAKVSLKAVPAPEETPQKPPKPAERSRPKGKKSVKKPKKLPAIDSDWDPAQFDVAPLEGKSRFQDFDLPEPILRAVYDLGFQYCTAIQAAILPALLVGRDASGRAQTGTGKTAAFLIAAFSRMLEAPAPADRAPGGPRLLVIAPTRELVLQISKEAESLGRYCDFNMVSVFGGMDYQKQRRQLTDQVVDGVVATPGRLIDFYRQKDIHLNQVEVLVIDEADRMLDMGFMPQVRQIVRHTPPKGQRQTLLFSATLTPEITRLAEQWTRQPVTVEIEPAHVAADSVDQLVYLVTSEQKPALVYHQIVEKDLQRVLVFCNRKDETRRLAELLRRYRINCAVLSGDVPQKKRLRTLEDFREGKIRVLVATDVAGRGLHVEGISHVINYTLPHNPEDYVHRIGRTGRAGASGTSVSFADEEDSFYIPEIEAFLGHCLECLHPEEEWLRLPPAPKAPAKKQRGGKRPPRRPPKSRQ